MIAYILQTSICLFGFYILYIIFLKQETFFSINRWYLLATLLISMLIPFLPGLLASNDAPAFVATIEPMAITIRDLSASLDKPDWYQFHWTDILLFVYIVGVALQLIRFFKGIIEILFLYRKGEKTKVGELTLIISEKPHLPFSFFKTLFLYKAHDIVQNDLEKIIRHESAHAKQWHSIDILLIEIVGAILWLNPIIYLYRKSLREIHEYLADAAVLQSAPLRTYGKLLLTQSQSGLQMALTNQFFQSQLKNRIKMMKRRRSSYWAGLKYLAIIPILLFTVSLFSFQQSQVEVKKDDKITELEKVVVVGYPIASSSDTIPVQKVHPIVKQHGIELKADVDAMPRFPGCENEPAEAKQSCATSKLLKHIYTNIRYPKEARKAGIQGKAVAAFVISELGKVEKVRIVEGLGYGIDKEVIRVIEMMNELDKTWIPAEKDGQPVALEMTIPVKFKLDGPAPAKKKADGSQLQLLPEGMEDERPLFVVDGEVIEEGNVQTIHPDDIATVDVVKPTESQLELYGPKAANGIIFIRLKNQDQSKAAPGEVFKVVEKMPRFPGCEDGELEGKELQNCSARMMLNYIYAHLKYPKAAKDACIQGRVVVKFIVTKEGMIHDPQVLRSLGGGTEEEVIRVIKSMNEMEERWIPGQQWGKNVNVEYTLPVSFKLEDDCQKVAPPPPPVGEEIFKIVEEMPRFPGCEDADLDRDALTKCSNSNLFAFIAENLVYPEEARSNHIEGMTVAQFIVRKDGTIDGIQILRSIGAGTDEAVTHVLSAMNGMDQRWIPGVQKGRKVDVMFTLPFRFKLTNEESNEAKQKIAQFPQSLKLDDFKVQPNPSSGLFNIAFSTKSDEPVYLYVFDISGQQVQSSSHKIIGGQLSTSIDLSKGEAGTYILKIIQGEEQFNTQIQKQ
jgi:TonB family protein